MKLRVVDLKCIAKADIDLEVRVGAPEIDSAVFTCISAASDSLRGAPPPGFSEFERDHLVHFIEGLRSSHISIRKLLGNGHNASTVDALVIARLQIESLFSFCFLLLSPENVRLFLKNGWKKTYVRFLLEKEERKELLRGNNFYLRIGPEYFESSRIKCFISDEEKRWIELDELGEDTTSLMQAKIPKFPTPMGVIDQVANTTQKAVLKRLYPEYQYLCSFAHGSAEASFYRTVTDSRSIARHLIESWKIADINQRQIVEPAMYYSALSCMQVATEILAIYPHDAELAAKVMTAWNLLLSSSLLASAMWELRAKGVLGII